MNDINFSRGKHSRVILKAYRFFLLGQEEALGYVDISDSEMTKMKKFHDKLTQGHSFYITGRTLCLPENISRAMWQMFQDWQDGKEIRDFYPSNETRPRIARVYELLLSGMSEKKLQSNGFMDFEIEKANLFRKYETADMLPATISQKTDIKISTIKKLQKKYREHQTGTAVVMREEMRAGVIAH